MRLRTEEPDLRAVPDENYDWEESFYGEVKEALYSGATKPSGKNVVTISLNHANLHQNVIDGRSVTGVLHFFSKTSSE